MSTTSPYSIRKLDITDLEAYKRLRLEALLLEPSVFSSNYEREAAFTVAEWKERLDNPQSASFGLFHNEDMAGITGIVITGPEQGEATLVASYIQKHHRGKGLSALLYRERIAWARNKGLKQIIVSHRKGNEPSRLANQRSGFRFTHEEMMQWPDGVTEANVYYRLRL